MTLLLWVGVWVVLSFAVAPLLGAAMRDRQSCRPVPARVKSAARGDEPARLPWSA